MILSDRTVQKMLDNKSLRIEPITAGQIQPASVDIRLGNTFSVVDDTPSGIIKLDSEIKYKMIFADTYMILPGQFVLATTMEYFELPDYLTAFVEEVPSAEWGYLFKMQVGLTPVSKVRSHSNYITRTDAL